MKPRKPSESRNRPSPASAAAGASMIWERPEPVRRPAPSPLSRELIVRTAMALADGEGLAAVSLRNVGAALAAGPMRLYGYLSTKEELLELMVDAVYGEICAAEPIRGDWRHIVSTLARRTRWTALRHRWCIDLLGGRPHLGPHALAYLETTLAALSDAPGFATIDAVMQAARTLNAYIVGAIRGELSELRAQLDSGEDEAAWQANSAPYIHRILATGRLPTLAKVVRDASHPPPEAIFETGLACVLDGIAARLQVSAL